MLWNVEYTDEFAQWWDSLAEADHKAISASVALLEEFGPELGFPHSSKIMGSKLSHLRELRIKSRGKQIRILYAFDPRRTAILLLGGDKTGDDRWYETHVPLAEKLYATYLAEIRKEGLIE